MVVAELAVERSYGVRTPDCYKDFAEEAVVEMKVLMKNLVKIMLGLHLEPKGNRSDVSS
tara:strand:+ start:1171 stop:1347 length:177 start_codon:yes stop_codon:yes gene_type:complete